MTTNAIQHDASWFDKVHSWIRDTLSHHNISLNGEIETIHQRPWSCILRVPSNSGSLYFKATVGIAAYEIGLTDYLSKLVPNHSPRLLAVNQERGWMIMQDGGQRLRESLIESPDWNHWETLLPQFAKVQQEVAKVPAELLALGIPNRSLTELPRLYQELLAETDWFQLDLPEGLSSAEYQRLQDLVPVVQEKSQQLASFAIPESLQHGDLHDANIFHEGNRYAFYDWGDSSFSHPFFSLRTAYVSAEIRFGLDEYSPELQRLRDAYLAAWYEYETPENLIAAFGLAEELWAISSALIWRQSILSSTPEEREDYAHVIPSLSKEFLSLIKA
jgi:hypothetical protein